jgi:8-oxo-dGTP diphosphatase
VKRLVVTAAVIERRDCYLLARRVDGTHLAGFWEFPGGKCEPGETLAACLARELVEELGVDSIVGEEVLTQTHDYDDRTVELHFFRCELMAPPTPQLGQELRWVPRAELGRLPLPPADAALVSLLMSPAR